MFRVYLCVTQQHDPRQVALAAAVCLVSALSAFFLYARVPQYPIWRRRVWLCLAGLVAGSGAWTAHFVGMLAFKTGLPEGFTAGGLAASLSIAVVGTTIALFVAAGQKGPSNAKSVIGGLIAGAAVAAMHYASLLDYRTTGRLVWDAGYVAASLATAFAMGILALFLARPAARIRRFACAGAVFSLGVLGLHFTAMSAISIMPDASITVPPSLIPEPMMMTIAVGVAGLVVLAALGVVSMDMTTRNAELHRLKQALDAMPEGLAFYDPQDRLVAWNARYERLCGPAAPLRAGRSFLDIALAKVHDGHIRQARGRELEWIEARLAARREGGRTLEVFTDQGQWMQVIDSRTPDGGTVTVSVDVTELKQAETAMAKARDAAEAAHRIKSQFLANMSHELRTPLNGIVGMNSLLLTTHLDAEQRHFSEVVRDSAEALLGLINDVFDMARLEAGDIGMRLQPVDPATVLKDIEARFAAEARTKGLRFDWRVDPEAHAPFLGDESRLRQVLCNLISNAIKFTEAGSVAVEGRPVGSLGERLRFEVKDTGIGVSAETRANLFQPFHQGDDSSTRRYGGAGLGLAICSHLVRLMDGAIGLDETVPKGSVFWVEVPRLPIPVGQTAAA